MSKLRLLITTIVILVLCTFGLLAYFSKINTQAEEKNNTNYASLFELKLYSDKKVYKSTDKIKIWATLKYVGKKNQIEIWHADPAINFYIADGKNFETGGLYNTILTSTILKKGKLYNYNYAKNGSYSNDDPIADFWKKFYSEKSLFLPVGKYKVTVGGAFSLSSNGKNSDLKKEIIINVVK